MPDIETGEAEGAAPTPETDVNAAESSSAEAGSSPDLSSVIDTALKGEEASAPSEKEPNAEASEPESQEKKEPESDDLPDDPTDDELKDAKPRTRQRIEALLDQRKELRGEVDSLKPKADQWDRIEEFRKANGMEPQHVANAIQIAALIESNPAKALEILSPVYDNLRQRAGEVLPDELEQRVRQGDISREDALRIARAEAARMQLQRQSEDTRKRESEQAQRQQVETQTNMLATVSSDWDREQASRDPDWSAKRDMAAATVSHRLTTAGMPDTPEAMVKLLNEAKKQVDATIGKFRQPKPAVARDPDGASSRDAKPRAPQNHMDVVNQALGDVA